jgi:capsule polysaccharide modification protein KpsS
MLPEFRARHALLLQGPVGPFFRRFANELQQHGINVTKVNFNAGNSAFFRGPEGVKFREPMDRWPQFLGTLLDDRDIDAVFLFGDCRPMHKDAVAICDKRDIPVWVFEEGYLRPNHVTIERGGVNGNSSLPKDPDFYRRSTKDLPEPTEPIPIGQTFGHAAMWATLNSICVTLFSFRYPHYRHHRNINAFKQFGSWVRGGSRKLWYGYKERHQLEDITGRLHKQYYFVPLQVHADAQLQHSEFGSMEEFMEEVVSSFATHAPAETHLVLKHHPHDRAYRDYTIFIDELAQKYACQGRLIYVHDVHLPGLLKSALGSITMNSTVGTSSLYHHTPVKVLGRAIYDMPGLTSQKPLAEFFQDPGEVDAELYAAFVRWLLETNQLNGSFYKRVAPTASGIHLARRRETSKGATVTPIRSGKRKTHTR